MRLRVIAAAAVVCLCAAAGTAAATPGEDLRRARDAFRKGDCATAKPALNLLLYPSAQLARTQDLVEAHILLGVCLLEEGDRKRAATEFEEALYLDEGASLDELTFSEEAREYFEETKQRMLERAAQDKKVRDLAEERDRLRKALDNLVVIERRPYYINFIPFGAGQFQNGQTGKGIFFFASETFFGGASLGIFFWQVGKYGFGGQVPREDVDFVRRMQAVQITSGIVTLGLMAWGIVDSLVNYEPTRTLEADPSLLPDSIRDPDGNGGGDDAAPREPEESSHLRILPRIVPTAGPDHGGLVLSWEF